MYLHLQSKYFDLFPVTSSRIRFYLHTPIELDPELDFSKILFQTCNCAHSKNVQSSSLEFAVVKYVTNFFFQMETHQPLLDFCYLGHLSIFFAVEKII